MGVENCTEGTNPARNTRQIKLGAGLPPLACTSPHRWSVAALCMVPGCSAAALSCLIPCWTRRWELSPLLPSPSLGGFSQCRLVLNTCRSWELVGRSKQPVGVCSVAGQVPELQGSLRPSASLAACLGVSCAPPAHLVLQMRIDHFTCILQLELAEGLLTRGKICPQRGTSEGHRRSLIHGR